MLDLLRAGSKEDGTRRIAEPRHVSPSNGVHLMAYTEDEGDLGIIGQDRELHLTLQETDFMWLKSVSEAVERIDSGDYGECLSCGQDFDEKTLAAFPWVALCDCCAR
jgi:RNA polymerase-binding transcription factor DksA